MPDESGNESEAPSTKTGEQDEGEETEATTKTEVAVEATDRDESISEKPDEQPDPSTTLSENDALGDDADQAKEKQTNEEIDEYPNTNTDQETDRANVQEGEGFAAETHDSELAHSDSQQSELLRGLENERAKYDEHLKMEVKAREELEDMLLRMEKHFKSEQESRKSAEEMMEQALQSELLVKKQLEETLQKHNDEARELDDERNSIKMERKALEGMRQEFENELQGARGEVAKAQDALKTAEDRVRAAERIERAKMEAEYQTRLVAVTSELQRVREELSIRTHSMGEEMDRWRIQAEYTAAAVIEAKNEVLERKRELDITKDRMDRLVEKLYTGREQGLVLHGAISAAQMYTGQSQARLLASMQNTYYQAMQTLPWGEQISQTRQLPALPANDIHLPKMEPVSDGQLRQSVTKTGPKRQEGGKGGKVGASARPGQLPPMPKYAHQAAISGQMKGQQAKKQQKLARQRSKDRFSGHRDNTFAAMSKWD